MTTTDWIAIISIIIAIFSLMYSAITNIDKFVISASERKNILDWYEKTNTVIEMLMTQIDATDEKIKKETLATLSTMIEVGRFYFPNISNGIGKHKPAAYQGSRHSILNFLIYIYNIGKDKDISKHINHIIILRKAYTSAVFVYLKPREYLRKLKQNSYLKISDDFKFEDFIKSKHPEKYRFY